MTTGIRIKDLPKSERPRERLAELGAGALRPAEFIAILLRTGMKGNSAIQIADQLVRKYQSLDALARASLEELQRFDGIGPAKAVTLNAAFTLARLMAAELQGESPLLDSPERIANHLREINRTYQVEQFQAVLLNTRRKLIRVELISQGILDSILSIPAKFSGTPSPPTPRPWSWSTTIPAATQPLPRRTSGPPAISSAPASF